MKKKIKEISNLVQAIANILNEIAEEIEIEDDAEKKSPVKENAVSAKSDITSEKKDNNKEVTTEELKEMSYKDLKTYAKTIGVKAIGTYKQLLDNILKTLGKEDKDESNEEEALINSANDITVSNEKPISAEKDNEEQEVNIESDDLRTELNKMDTKELADILVDAGLSVKGKKEALITRIIKAVEDGLIEFEEEDEDESAEETETEENDGNTDDSEYKLNNPKNPNMTKERKEALSALAKEIQADIKKNKITDEDMTEFLISVGYTKKEVSGLDDIANTYLQERALFINDDGEEAEIETPYTLNGEPACCGRLLEKDGDTYTCSICGNEYEVDED